MYVANKDRKTKAINLKKKVLKYLNLQFQKAEMSFLLIYNQMLNMI